MKLIKIWLCIVFLLFSLIGSAEATSIKPNSLNNSTPNSQQEEEIFIPEMEEGVYIEVNKTKNILQVYLNGISLYTFRIATGKNIELTPEGKFKIVTKVKDPWYIPKNIPGGNKKNPLGSRWLGINVPETGGYKYGIHGTNNPYSIGRHISSGCIRMHNRDIEWLFRHIPLNTPVIIKR